MKKQGLLTDRQELVTAIERVTGQKAIYCGPPSFKYEIGSCTVNRSGKVESMDIDLMNLLSQVGLVEDSADDCPITFPTKGFTGRTLVNLVNSFAARSKMINKAIDQPNAFHVSVELVRKLKEENPSTIPDFLDVVYRIGKEKSMRGLGFSNTMVSFPGFPDTPTNRLLTELMVKAALKQGWIKPEAKPTKNEKYSFRVWLMAIGMKGPEYKQARSELLSHFDGDPSFRTEEQRAAFYASRKKKEVMPDFVLL